MKGPLTKDGATGLTRKQMNYLRAKLLEKRRQLLAQLQGGLHKAGRTLSEGPGGDLLDLAQDSEEVESSYQVAERESNAVGAIESAIERLDAGTYGICESCGVPIPPARLKALPSAALCVGCKETQESSGGSPSALAYERIRDVPDALYDPETVYGSVRGRKLS